MYFWILRIATIRNYLDSNFSKKFQKHNVILSFWCYNFVYIFLKFKIQGKSNEIFSFY